MKKSKMILFNILLILTYGISQSNDSGLTVKQYNEMARSLIESSPETSLQYSKNAFQRATQQNDWIEIVNALNNMGIAYAEMENFQPSNEYFEKALKFSKDKGMKYQEANTLINLGKVNLLNSKLNKCLFYWLQSKDIISKNGLNSLYPLIHQNLGIIYSELNDYSTALNYLFVSLNKYELKCDTANISNVLSSIGNVYYNSDKFDVAESYYLKALSLSKSINNTGGLKQSYLNLGNTNLSLGKYELALTDYNNFLTFSDKDNKSDDITLAKYNIGKTYLQMNEFELAIQNFEESIKIGKDTKNDYRTALSLYGLAEVLTRTKNFKQAEECFSQALIFFKKENQLNYISEIYLNLSNLFNAKKNIRLAFDYYRYYSEINQQIKSEEQSKLLNYVKMKNDAEIEISNLKKDVVNKELEFQKFRNNLIFLAIIFIIGISVLYVYYKLKTRIKKQEKNLMKLQTLKESVHSRLSNEIKELLTPITIHIVNTSNGEKGKKIADIYSLFIKRINEMLIDVKL